MAFLRNRTKYQQWWLGLSLKNQCGVTYQHGELCCLLGLSSGLGPHSSGGTYSSLLEWQGNRKFIEKLVQLSGASWFLPFFERGIESEVFSEEEVLNAFRRQNGFDPIPFSSSRYPVEAFTTAGERARD